MKKLLFLVAALYLSVALWGCAREESPLAPNAPEPEWTLENPLLCAVADVQERHSEALMADPEVIGTAVTVGEDGRPAILLLVTSAAAKSAAPEKIDEVPVIAFLTDPIVSMVGEAPGKAPHTAKQAPPIRLGTSGGWRYDLANGYCCGGTLGSLINRSGQLRILSNYHVFEADIVSGGNSRVAKTGDYIIQPALIDVSCNASNAQNVATLVVSKTLPNYNIDASTAPIISGMVRTDGYILAIGTLSKYTTSAYVGQYVKKSGRTTGLTRSYINGLNASISVSYSNECAGGTAFTKTFTGQIVVRNSSSAFLKGGDSGSLLVQDVTTRPRAIGLLFAGSSTTAIANPISAVLNHFGATMVGS
jgi:hypothetical protein